MTDDELMRFSSENELLRVEREPNGEIIVMPPSGCEGVPLRLKYCSNWLSGQDTTGVEESLAQVQALPYRTPQSVRRMLPG